MLYCEDGRGEDGLKVSIKVLNLKIFKSLYTMLLLQATYDLPVDLGFTKM